MTGLQGRTVLIVEDDRATARGWRQELDRVGARSLWAGTLAKALETTADEAPAAAIVDVRLPDGTGFDAMRALSRPPVWCSSVVVTGDRNHEWVRMAYELGAVGMLYKPFHWPALREMLELAVSRSDQFRVLHAPRTTPRDTRRDTWLDAAVRHAATQHNLTRPEIDVLSLQQADHSIKEIASHAGLSIAQVKRVQKRLRDKFAVEGRGGLAAAVFGEYARAVETRLRRSNDSDE